MKLEKVKYQIDKYFDNISPEELYKILKKYKFMEKTPCIKCTPELWEYIRPYLEEWGYKPDSTFDDAWIRCPLLIINSRSFIGYYNNVNILDSRNNRILTTNVEEFLEKTAKLKGKTYKRKDIMKINGIEIKPGIVIEIQYENKKVSYVVFPLLDGELGLISYNETSWDNIKYFVKHYLSEIVCIRDLPSDEGGLTGGKILWERPKTVEYTMQEIADKLGIPVELLRIKE